jgi:hypothetical protein
MVERGFVPNLQAAFDRYIDNSGPAYVPRFHLTVIKAVELIHQAGGIAVVAHPGRYKTPITIVEETAAYGIDGVEVFYPEHTPGLRSQLKELAARLGLIITGGSDFHREENGGYCRLGVEAEFIPPDTVEIMTERANRYRK